MLKTEILDPLHIKHLERQLGRNLTPEEISALWNDGSLMTLDQCGLPKFHRIEIIPLDYFYPRLSDKTPKENPKEPRGRGNIRKQVFTVNADIEWYFEALQNLLNKGVTFKRAIDEIIVNEFVQGKTCRDIAGILKDRGLAHTKPRYRGQPFSEDFVERVIKEFNKDNNLPHLTIKHRGVRGDDTND